MSRAKALLLCGRTETSKSIHGSHNFLFFGFLDEFCLFEVEPRREDLPNQSIITIRSSILSFVNRLMLMNAEESPETNRDEEIHTILNFVATVNEVRCCIVEMTNYLLFLSNF